MDSMKIEIRNLGPVKHVDLDLSKDFVILCGPNNTGKTYIAYTIYGLMKLKPGFSGFKKSKTNFKSIIENGKIDLDLSLLLDEFDADYFKRLGDYIAKNLSRVFASDNNFFDGSTIKIELNNYESLKEKLLNLSLKENYNIGNIYTLSFEKDQGAYIIQTILTTKGKKEELKSDIPGSVIVDVFTDRIYSLFTQIIFPETYFIPAERIAINIFSKELSLKRNVLVDKLLELKDSINNSIDDPFDLIKRRASRYPMPIRDSLEIAEDLNNFKKGTSDFSGFADQIENEILRGKVVISKEGEVQFKPKIARSPKLPIHMSASVVKSLSNLVLYFRHIAKSNDLIIIDEPELNLHPDNQIIIARILAKAVNLGFKVVISTHSDYIIREINNLIMLSERREMIEKYQYSEDMVLDPSRVSAILFPYKNNRGAINLDVDNSGFEVSTIDEVINQLNSRSEDLYYNLLDSND